MKFDSHLCVKFILTGVVAASAPAQAQAQTAAGTEQVLITGSRALSGIRTDLLGASYNVVEPLDIELRQIEIVSDVLRDIPGVAVSRTGAVGGLTQVRIRGAESNHTMVMIDGIEASDPVAGEFDWATLIADDAAKIEVLRGQQSALYGSAAIGGVIQYITLSGAEAPGTRVRMEGGSFDTASGSVRIAGVNGALDYALNASLSRTGGTPAVPDGERHLGADNESFSGKFIYTVADNIHVTAVGRYMNLNADSTPQSFSGSNFGFAYEIDPSNPGQQVMDATGVQSLYGLLRGDVELLNGQWTHSLTIQGVVNDRKNYDDLHDLSSESYGTRRKASYATTFNLATGMLAHALTFAADFKRETYQSKPVGFPPDSTNDKRTLDNTGYVGQYDLRIGSQIGLGAALRYDDNTHFENATTYRFQGSYLPIDSLRLRAAAGTGITNPTNTELFGFDPNSFIGNPNLKPERSEGWEAGFDQSFFANMVTLSATYFDNRLKDEIYTVFTPSFLATPDNRTTVSTEKGVEIWLSARLDQQWRLDASWTNLHALEGSSGAQEVRRAPNIASLNISWRAPNDQYGVNLTVRYNGEQRDFQFTPTATLRVPMPDYALVNLGADYRISDTWRLYARVENLLDKKYQDVFSFEAPGRAACAGIRFTMR